VVPRAAAEVVVGARSHPYLADHVIAGTPVVPVALALEWLAAAAGAGQPGPVVLRDVRVLRKLALDRFSGAGHRLVVRTRPDQTPAGGDGTVGGRVVELLGEGGALHYRAVTEPTGATGPTGGGVGEGRGWPGRGDLLPARRGVLYDGHTLFHGPRFRSIVSLGGVSPAGAMGTLCGAGELGWPRHPGPAGGSGGVWHVDPAAVDGAFQLAVLWAEPLLGGACLPMVVGQCRVYRPGLLDAPVVCTVRAGRVGEMDAECDIRLVDPDGGVRMELLRVAVVLRPAASAAAAA
jgi:hypothetical protein